MSPGKFNLNCLFYRPNQPSTVDLFLDIQSLATSPGSLFWTETSYAIQETSSAVIWKLLKKSTIAGDLLSREVPQPIWICFSASLEAT